MASQQERNTVTPMTWAKYVRGHLKGRTQADLAEAVGISQTAVSRWLKGTQGADAHAAVALARAVNDNPQSALIAAGVITAVEAGERPAAAPSMDAMSDDELIEELRWRLSQTGNDGPVSLTRRQRMQEASTTTESAAYSRDYPPDPHEGAGEESQDPDDHR